MKQFLIVLIVCMFVLSANIFGGEKNDEKGDKKDNGKLDLAFISVSAGGDAISPGFTASAFFEDDRGNELKIKGSSDGMSYVACFLKLPLIEVGPYIGYYLADKNTPDPDVFNIGLYAKSSVGGFLTLFYWKGWKFADDKEQSWKIGKFLDMWGAYLSIWLIDVGYSHLNLDGAKSHIPGIYLSIPINKNFMIFAGADCKIDAGKNKEKREEMLFKFGLVYSPKK